MMPINRVNGSRRDARPIILRGGPFDGKEIEGILDDVETLEFFPASQREPAVTRYSYHRTLLAVGGRAVFEYRAVGDAPN